jgi:hypothetical protein
VELVPSSHAVALPNTLTLQTQNSSTTIQIFVGSQRQDRQLPMFQVSSKLVHGICQLAELICLMAMEASIRQLERFMPTFFTIISKAMVLNRQQTLDLRFWLVRLAIMAEVVHVSGFSLAFD